VTKSIDTRRGTRSGGLEETVKDQEDRKDYIGSANKQVGFTHPLKNGMIDAPGENGKQQIPREPSQEKLNSERRVLRYPFSFPQ